MRVRVRCAGSTCGYRFTVSGGVRDWQAEAERRRAFFDALATLTPLVGIVRARDRAVVTTGTHFTTASRKLAGGVIGPDVRRYRGSADYYSMVEQVVRVYGLAQRRQNDFPICDPRRPDPPVRKIDNGLFWLLLSRARGIAALVLGLPRPSFGEPAPAAFPSWIDRGARGVDPMRGFYPLSRHACAAEIIERLHQTVVAETPNGYWASPGASDWLRTKVAPMTLLSHTAQRHAGADAQLRGAAWWGPGVEEFDVEPPPVPEPTMALRILNREILYAKRLSASALAESVDEGLRYWVELAGAGNVVRVRVTHGGRTVGRAEARLTKPFRIADNAAELRLVKEDQDAKNVKLAVGRGKFMIPWRSTAGADHELAGRLVSAPAPAARKSHE